MILLVPAWRAATVHDGWSSPATVAAVVEAMGARVCHQRPERSFHRHGQPMPVCGRCAGLYLSGTAGLLLGLAAQPWRRPPPRSRRADAVGPAPLQPRAAALAIAAVPTLVTWSLEILDLWNPGTPLRALAAVPLGAVAGWMLATPHTPPPQGGS